MGLSVSGSAAIIFVAVILAVGSAYTAGSNSLERIQDARADAADSGLDTENGAIAIASASYHPGNATLHVDVANTGTIPLDVAAADLLVDNTYIVNGSTTVEGDGETQLWLPGERLRFEVDLPTDPDLVKVIAEFGLADRAVV